MSAVVTGAMVVCWYAASVMALVTAKLSVTALHVPLALCASQFVAATVLTSVLLAVWPQPQPQASRRAAAITRQLAASYTAGFVLTNFALARAPAPFIETVKAGEPITTVALAALLLGER